jgi:hypothetical protein
VSACSLPGPITVAAAAKHIASMSVYGTTGLILPHRMPGMLRLMFAGSLRLQCKCCSSSYPHSTATLAGAGQLMCSQKMHTAHAAASFLRTHRLLLLVPAGVNDEPVVTEVSEGSAAEAAGVRKQQQQRTAMQKLGTGRES